MPKQKQKTPPEVFMKLGKIEIVHEDERNWTVQGDGHPNAYFSSPFAAILYASGIVPDTKASTALEWLAEYRKVAQQISREARKIAQVVESKGK